MLTTIEKYILESISKGNHSVLCIHKDTELEPSQLKNILIRLIEKEVLILKDEQYYLRSNEETKNKKKYKFIEMAQIIKNNIRNSIQGDSSQFKMRKVYLNSQEEKIFNSLLFNLEDFLNGLPQNKGKTSKERLIFWGENTYQNIINDLCGLNNTHGIA